MTVPTPNAETVVAKRGIWGWVMFDWAAQLLLYGRYDLRFRSLFRRPPHR